MYTCLYNYVIVTEECCVFVCASVVYSNFDDLLITSMKL